MEQDPGDAEAVNSAFRAAHTIKGGAGLFGFRAVVGFTLRSKACSTACATACWR